MKLNKLIILSLITVLAFSLFAGCRKIGDETYSSCTSDLSSTVYDIVDVIEDTSDNAQLEDNTTSSENQESGDTDNTSNINSERMPDNIVIVGDNESSDNTNEESLPPTFIEEDDNNTSNDSGTATEGYSGKTFATSPNENGKLVTVKIAPNSSVYYKINRVANKVLTINSPNAFVVYNDNKYTAKNGVLSFFVESDLLASDQILFEIGNSGSQKESFTIQFKSPVGSRDNPEVLNNVGENISKKIEAGNDQGYSYSYVANKDGKIRFYILSDATKGKIAVDKIINPKLQVVLQRTTDDSGEDYLKKDSIGTYIEFDVVSGDKFTITVAHNSNGSDSSAINIEWKAVYA